MNKIEQTKQDVYDILFNLTDEYKSIMSVWTDEVDYQKEFISKVCRCIDDLVDDLVLSKHLQESFHDNQSESNSEITYTLKLKNNQSEK